MTACSNCGVELPEGALYCPDCGARALDYSIMPSSVSPSHFNSGITSTAPPPAQPEAQGFASPPQPPAEERRRSFAARAGPVLVIIALLAVVLVGTAFATGMLGSGGGPAGTAVNSASSPLTGEQLYSAYASNKTQADASYTNKTVYIQDSLDMGAVMDLTTGHYYSSLDSGAVVLYWSTQSQVSQLYQGATVLARCSVEGVQGSPSAGFVVSLQNCDLISVQSLAPTVSITVNND